MTMEKLGKIEKTTKQLNELSELREKTIKLSRKFHKLTMKLSSTEAYDPQFKKIENAENSFHAAVEWINKEIEFQTSSLTRNEMD